MQHNNAVVGRNGEKLAFSYLQDKGYTILKTNVRLKNNEVDLIAFDKATKELVFVEVKTRNTEFFGFATQAVTNKKIQSMQKVASYYMRSVSWQNDYRFDTIAIVINNKGQAFIEHFENITWN